MIKISLLLIMMTIGLNGHATAPSNLPQSVYDDIVTQVMLDNGFFDAIAVEKAISQWQLDQPLPASDGQLLASGNCSNCVGDNQGVDTSFKQPRKVKIKGRTNPNGDYPVTYKITWKAPKRLNANSSYELAGYNVYLSLNGASYEVYHVTPQRKRNGKLKKNQQIKFKDKPQGNYSVQVQALYQEKTTTASSNQNLASPQTVSTKALAPNKTSSTAVSTNNSQNSTIQYISSDWTNPSLFVLDKNEKIVSSLTGALKTCINNAGYLDTDSLDIFIKLDCRNTNLQNSDISQLDDLYNLRSLIISNNSAITDISPLENLAYLRLLSLEDNTNINLNLTNIVELQDLYLGNMGLTNLPDLSLHTNLEFIDISDNQIASGFVTNLPTDLKSLVLNNNPIFSCDGLAGINIEAIEMSGKVETIADCSSVSGLKFINVSDAPNLLATQNIGGFNHGLCGLSFDNTNIRKLQGFKPIYSLAVMNSTSFYKVKSLNDYDLDSVAQGYMLPGYVNFTGSSNMKCSNVNDAKVRWDTLSHVGFNPTVYNLTNGTTITSQSCPEIKAQGFFNKEATCKNPITVPKACKPIGN